MRRLRQLATRSKGGSAGAIPHLAPDYSHGPLVFDTYQLEPFEIAAKLHVRLAYPDAKQKRYADLVRSVCVDQVSVFIEEKPEKKAEILARFPGFDPRGNRTQGKNIIAPLEDAQRMGAVALALIKGTAEEDVDYRPPILDFAVRRIWQLPEPTTVQEQDRCEHRIQTDERDAASADAALSLSDREIADCFLAEYRRHLEGDGA